MTKKTKIITGSAAAIALLGAGVAFAQTREDRPDLTRTAVSERSAEMFERMDVNSDGQLNEADREARAAQRFAQLDTNSDGAISEEEFSAMRERRAEAREARGGERKMRGKHHRRGGHGMRGMRGGRMMERADADGNGSVSQAEFSAAMLARFDAADTDNNGTIDAAERKDLQKALKRQLVKRSSLLKIVSAWIITVPVSAFLAALFYFVLRGMMLQ